MKEQEEMEQEIRELLNAHAANEFALHTVAPLVAKKSLRMNHLYQDLGFKNRVEMGLFMKTYFPVLAVLKPRDKLYRAGRTGMLRMQGSGGMLYLYDFGRKRGLRWTHWRKQF